MFSFILYYNIISEQNLQCSQTRDLQTISPKCIINLLRHKPCLLYNVCDFTGDCSKVIYYANLKTEEGGNNSIDDGHG